MADVTVEQLYEQAKQLSPEERRRLAELLLKGEVEKPEPTVSVSADPFADDPQMAEWREAMKRAEEALGLHGTEEIMSYLRKRLWGFDE